MVLVRLLLSGLIVVEVAVDEVVLGLFVVEIVKGVVAVVEVVVDIVDDGGGPIVTKIPTIAFLSSIRVP